MDVGFKEHFLSRVEADAYLELLKKVLTRLPFGVEDYLRLGQLKQLEHALLIEVQQWAMLNQDPVLAPQILARSLLRLIGAEWPTDGETMIGLLRLENLHRCIQDVIRRGVPGDLLEAGVWRGGACILMRAALYAYGATDRNVWVADSFQGMPPPNLAKYPQDNHVLWMNDTLAVALDNVKSNFRRYGLLDDHVRFLQGWFSETLPHAPLDRLAILRLDGGLYESTIETLQALYHKVSPRGYVIVDDYGAVSACRQAIQDFRRQHAITQPIRPIDWTGVFWEVA